MAQIIVPILLAVASKIIYDAGMGKNDESKMLSVRLPPDVKQALLDEAAREDRTIGGQLLRILRERYKLPHPDPSSRSRRQRRQP